MKVSLVVLTAGKWEGKVIPITLSQFLIGRDPQCQLRPASEVISKRHCAVLLRSGKVFVRDFDSTNGTFVNEEAVKGEVELHHEDRMKAGPLAFKVLIEQSTPVDKPTPAPPTKVAVALGDDDDIAAMLLDNTDVGSAAGGSPGDVPEGSTVMEMRAVENTDEQPKPNAALDKSKPAAKAGSGDTSSAAKSILDKYMRRPRS